MNIVLVKCFFKATSYMLIFMRMGDKYFGFAHCFISRWSNYALYGGRQYNTPYKSGILPPAV